MSLCVDYITHMTDHDYIYDDSDQILLLLLLLTEQAGRGQAAEALRGRDGGHGRPGMRAADLQRRPDPLLYGRAGHASQLQPRSGRHGREREGALGCRPGVQPDRRAGARDEQTMEYTTWKKCTKKQCEYTTQYQKHQNRLRKIQMYGWSGFPEGSR